MEAEYSNRNTDYGQYEDMFLMDWDEKPNEAGLKLTISPDAANALLGDKEKCLTAGMNGYLSKPVTRQSLSTEMAKVLSLPVMLSTDELRLVLPQEEPQGLQSTVHLSAAEELLWDRTAFLKSLGGMAEMEMALVHAFINTLLKNQAEFMLAVRDANDQSMQMISHSLKGSAGQMYCKPLAETATELNRVAKLKDYLAVQAEQPKFEKVLSDTLRLLQRIFAENCAVRGEDDRTKD
jgi:CheY-like chemotaxis protein